MESKSTPTIRDLYPNLTDEELLIAEDNIERYLSLVLRIFDRLELEAKAQPDSKLTPKSGEVQCSS